MKGYMNFNIECEQEEDGRWIAEVPDLPGVPAYGETGSFRIYGSGLTA